MFSSLAIPNHICSIFNSAEEQAGIVSAYLQRAHQMGGKIIYLADSNTYEKISSWIGNIFGDFLQENPSSCTPCILNASSALDSNDIFTPRRLMTWLQSETYAALESGCSSVWLAIEMSWQLRGAPDLAAVFELNAWLNELTQSNDCVVLCQFDRRFFSASQVLDAIMTHPSVIVNEHLYENFYYSQPVYAGREEFIEERLRQWIDNLDARRRAEEDLLLTRFWVESVPDAIFWIGKKGEIFYANQAASRRLGYSKEDLLKLNVSDIDSRFNQTVWDKYWDQLKRAPGILIKSQQKTRDGRLIPVEIHLNHIEFDGREYTCAVTVDITTRVHHEEKLRQSEERFRMLVENVRDHGIYMLDPEGKVVSWNAGAERLLGYTAEEVSGQAHTLFYIDEDRARGLPQFELAMAARKGSFDQRGWRVRKDGSRFWGLAIISALHDQNGELLGFIKIVRDISEQKRAEDTLRMNRPNVLEE